MKKRNKKLIKNTFIFALGSFATKFISFFLVPLYTSVLSTEEYGTVDLIYTICTILVPIFTLNIAESIMRFALDKKYSNNEIIRIGNFMIIVSTILGAIMIPIVSRVEILNGNSLYFYLYFVSLSASQIYLANLKGQEKLVEYSIGNVIHTLTIAIFNIIFLLYLKLGITGYFTAYIISNIITSLYAFLVGKCFDIKILKLDKTLFKKMIKYSIVLIPTSFMWWIMNSSDRIMVTEMVSIEANGIYAVSYKIPSLISTIITTFTQAWLFSAIQEKDSNDYEEYTNKIYKSLFSISVIMGIGIFMIIKYFLKFYVTGDYYTAWKYIPFLIIGVIFQTLATFVSTSYNVNKDNKGFLYSGLVGALLNIILNFILIPHFKVYGAAFATCISYLTVFFYRIIDTKKYVKINILEKRYIICYILLVISAATVYINNIFGQLLLIFEFISAILIFKKEYIYIYEGFKKKFKLGEKNEK